MVYHATRKVRTIFRKIPVKSHFWLITDTLASTAPRFRYNQAGYLAGWDSTNAAVVTGVTPGTQVIRAPSVFLGQVHVNA